MGSIECSSFCTRLIVVRVKRFVLIFIIVTTPLGPRSAARILKATVRQNASSTSSRMVLQITQTKKQTPAMTTTVRKLRCFSEAERTREATFDKSIFLRLSFIRKFKLNKNWVLAQFLKTTTYWSKIRLHTYPSAKGVYMIEINCKHWSKIEGVKHKGACALGKNGGRPFFQFCRECEHYQGEIGLDGKFVNKAITPDQVTNVGRDLSRQNAGDNNQAGVEPNPDLQNPPAPHQEIGRAHV